MDTTEIIKTILETELDASHVEIMDESEMHRGHKAAGGGGHYTVIVVSSKFENVDVLNQRRLVYGALKNQIQGTSSTPKLIHALQIKSFTPQEWEAKI